MTGPLKWAGHTRAGPDNADQEELRQHHGVVPEFQFVTRGMDVGLGQSRHPMPHAAAGGFIRRVRLTPDAPAGRYPFSLPVVAWLARSDGLALLPG